MPRKPKPVPEVSDRYYPQKRQNGYGLTYWVVIDGDNEHEPIEGRMPDAEAASRVAAMYNTGIERKSCVRS